MNCEQMSTDYIHMAVPDCAKMWGKYFTKNQLCLHFSRSPEVILLRSLFFNEGAPKYDFRFYFGIQNG